MITEIIDLLRKGDFYGAGKYTEIAKGENEIIQNFSVFKRKIKRKWQSRKL